MNIGRGRGQTNQIIKYKVQLPMLADQFNTVVKPYRHMHARAHTRTHTHLHIPPILLLLTLCLLRLIIGLMHYCKLISWVDRGHWGVTHTSWLCVHAFFYMRH